MSGGEHYRNFKNYIKNNGLPGLIKKEKFKLVKHQRMSSGAIIISIYQKINKKNYISFDKINVVI